MKVLAAWLGNADVQTAQRREKSAAGPIAQALAAAKYDQLLLLANQPRELCGEYVAWLGTVVPTPVKVVRTSLSSPTSHREILEAASAALDDLRAQSKGDLDLTLHLSPGTPAMHAIWVILGRTKYPAKLIQSSPEKGIEPADIPFEIAAEFIPHLLRSADQKRINASEERPPGEASFGDILYRSGEMAKVVGDATKAALRKLPVLIEGESGTGKELLATAIHNYGPRSKQRFVVVNCGAIPATLVESEFFGHKKGTFTGAISDKSGAFEEANGGTLFLDEIGELSLSAQVTLLRALQESEVTRIGENKPRRVDVRIIAATNRKLIEDVAAGRFREDLYYRLAVATLRLPPLRERKGDLGLLADRLLNQVNNDAKNESGYKAKKYSVGARRVVLAHTWPGNVRELLNTLRRVTLFSDGEQISESDMRRAIQPAVKGSPKEDGILNHPIAEGFDLNALIEKVAKHYLQRAMKETGGNKTKAAKLIGLPSYQTLANWLERYGID